MDENAQPNTPTKVCGGKQDGLTLTPNSTSSAPSCRPALMTLPQGCEENEEWYGQAEEADPHELFDDLDSEEDCVVAYALRLALCLLIAGH